MRPIANALVAVLLTAYAVVVMLEGLPVLKRSKSQRRSVVGLPGTLLRARLSACTDSTTGVAAFAFYSQQHLVLLPDQSELGFAPIDIRSRSLWR
jgi:hypothetical protein